MASLMYAARKDAGVGREPPNTMSEASPDPCKMVLCREMHVLSLSLCKKDCDSLLRYTGMLAAGGTGRAVVPWQSTVLLVVCSQLGQRNVMCHYCKRMRFVDAYLECGDFISTGKYEPCVDHEFVCPPARTTAPVR